MSLSLYHSKHLTTSKGEGNQPHAGGSTLQLNPYAEGESVLAPQNPFVYTVIPKLTKHMIIPWNTAWYILDLHQASMM